MSLSSFLKAQKKANLEALCINLNLSPEGKVHELRVRLYEYAKNATNFEFPGFAEWKQAQWSLTPEPNTDINEFFKEDIPEVITPSKLPFHRLAPFAGREGLGESLFGEDSPNKNDTGVLMEFVQPFMQGLKDALVGAFREKETRHHSNTEFGHGECNRAKNRQVFLREAKDRNIRFTGDVGENVAKVFRRLDDLRLIYPIDDSDMLNIMPELCEEAALRYLKTHSEICDTWEKTKAQFNLIFTPYESATKLKADIMLRTQIANEKIDYYISVIKTMNARLTFPISGPELLSIILDNLHLDYARILKGKRVSSLEELAEICREEEKLLEKERKYQPPPARLFKPHDDWGYSERRNPTSAQNSSPRPNDYQRYKSPERRDFQNTKNFRDSSQNRQGNYYRSKSPDQKVAAATLTKTSHQGKRKLICEECKEAEEEQKGNERERRVNFQVLAGNSKS